LLLQIIKTLILPYAQWQRDELERQTTLSEGFRNDGSVASWRGISHPAQGWFMSEGAEAGIRNDGALRGRRGISLRRGRPK